MNFIDTLKQKLVDWLPKQIRTIRDQRNEPPSQHGLMTADTVHAAIQAAETGETRDLFGLYRDALRSDSHLQAEFSKRLLAVLGDNVSVQPWKTDDKAAPEDEQAAKVIREAIDRAQGWNELIKHLLVSTLWPVSLVERAYKPADPGLGVRFDWLGFRPVPMHLLSWRNGEMQIEDVDPASAQLTGKLMPVEPSRYIVHRGHLLGSLMPDNWGGPMYCLLWWFFLKFMDRDWWIRFLEKFGQPFIVGKFDKNDDTTRQVLERAFSLARRIGGLVVTRETQIELVQASTSQSADAHEKFFAICNREMSKLIVGQTMSAEAQSSGMNSGNADVHNDVRDDVRQFDGKMLAETLRHQLFAPFLRVNGLPGRAPVLVFGEEESDDNKSMADALASLNSAGLVVADASIPVVSRRLGIEMMRAQQPVPQTGLTVKKLSAPGVRDALAASDAISREAAAMLSQVLRGSLAPARDIVLSADSPEEAQRALLAAFTDWEASRVADIVEMAVTAGAWNGVQDRQ